MHFAWICSYYASIFCSLLLPSYFSKNYAGKISSSLDSMIITNTLLNLIHFAAVNILTVTSYTYTWLHSFTVTFQSARCSFQKKIKLFEVHPWNVMAWYQLKHLRNLLFNFTLNNRELFLQALNSQQSCSLKISI